MDFRAVAFLLLVLLWKSEAKLPEVKIESARALSPKKIKLTWSSSLNPNRRAVYIIRHKEKGGTFSRIRSKTHEVVIKGLKPDTVYLVDVKAVVGRSRGPWSKIWEVRTNPKADKLKDTEKVKIYVDEVEEKSVSLTWNFSGDAAVVDQFSELELFVKSKDHQLKRRTREHDIIIDGLKPNTGYAVNMFGIDKKGERVRLARVKFLTLNEQFLAPRKLRVKSVTEHAVEIKWKLIKSGAADENVTGHILEYKQSGASGDVCVILMGSDKKSFKIKGLQQDENYLIRVAGVFNNVTGAFTDWIQVSTLKKTDDIPDILVYHISPNRVLLSWNNNGGSTNKTVVVVQEISDNYLTTADNDAPRFITTPKRFEVDTNKFIVNDLQPETHYEITITYMYEHSCERMKKRRFKTVEAKCFKQCPTRKLNETTVKYESQLRIIPLPENKHVVVWDPFDPFDYNDTIFDYVVNVLGEPFLYHLSSHLIPNGQHFTVITELNISKTYTINLQVFSSSHGGRPYVSQHLLVHPYEDLVGTNYKQKVKPLESVWQATSFDTIIRRDFENISQYDIDDGNIDGTDFILMTRTVLDNSLLDDDYDAESANSPNVFKIPTVEARESSDVDVLCSAVGDPYPEVTLLNISANQVLGEEETNVNRTVFTVDRKYVGSSSLVNGQVFMGIRTFITFRNLTIHDTGLYACVAENEAGEGNATFQLIVLPRPPKKVQNLFAIASTPFDIIVTWTPVENKLPNHPGYVLGYHVTIMDEFGVELREPQTTNLTKMTVKNMSPETIYRVQVSAFHQYDTGEPITVEVQTKPIPLMGPPQKLTANTRNNSTIQMSWIPPEEVIEGNVKLRGYVFQYKEVGTQNVEEMQLNKQFLNVSMVGLKPNCVYEAMVTAMSEDAQISSTKWLQANTSKESYMNESVAPPPPSNVYLNLKYGNIIVSWLKPAPDENILVRGYVIDVFFNTTKLQTMEVGSEESSVIIYDVEMGILYRISVRAKNRAGLSLHHWEELRIPREFVTQSPVENFQGTALSSTELELSWDPPSAGVFSHFFLSYTLDDVQTPELPGGGNLPAIARSYIVRSLRPFTGYMFFITPYLKDIRGITSNTTVKTLTDSPSSPPNNVTLTVINSTTILIRCNPPASGKNGPIVQYEILYRQATFRNSFMVPADENENLSHLLTGLDQNTVYEIRVRASTVNGSGPWSLWLQERTPMPEPVLPLMPRNLTTNVTQTTITLTWQPPVQDLKEITGFIVGKGRFIPEVHRVSLTRDERKYTFYRLEPKSTYIVSVRSFNAFGESEALFDLVTTL